MFELAGILMGCLLVGILAGILGRFAGRRYQRWDLPFDQRVKEGPKAYGWANLSVPHIKDGGK